MTTKIGCGVAAVLLLAMLAWPVAAQAAPTCQNRAGLQICYDSVWSNELAPGAPVMQFPLRCETTDTCQFTIRLDFFPGYHTGDPDETCVDDPATPWFDCNPFAQCIVWAQFGPSVMPLSDQQYRIDPVTGVPADKAVLVIAFDGGGVGGGRTTGSVFAGAEALHGNDYQLLHVVAGEVDVHPDEGLCRAGLAVLYYPNSKTVFEQGLLTRR